MSSNHYVSNKQLYESLVEYRIIVFDCRERGVQPPPIPEYIGACLLLMANKLSNKPNFIGYSHKEDMVADGVENCVRYLVLFDPERSNNPFAYFSQVIKNAFIRRIKTEKKQFYLRCKATQTYQLTSQLSDNGFLVEENDTVNQYIASYEDAIEKKKQEGRK